MQVNIIYDLAIIMKRETYISQTNEVNKAILRIKHTTYVKAEKCRT